MSKFDNTINTNSSMLGGFMYHGTYETLEGEMLGYVKPSDREAAEKEIAGIYIDMLESVLSDALPSDVDDSFELAYTGMYHPRFYNFETDSIEFTFEYDDSLKSYLAKYAEDNKDDFDQWLHDNFTSRDGFYSFTPNNYTEWFDGFNENNTQCVSALLTYFLHNECYEETERYGFIEEVDVLIREDFTPYEYAVKFKNGYVGYCVENYDEDENCDRFDAYLFDSDGNLVNTTKMYDAYTELNFSAYLAWEEMERDITNKYEHVGYGYDEMDVAEFHKLYDDKIDHKEF